METIRVEKKILNGQVIVDNLPFDDGKDVEIIVTEIEKKTTDKANPYPLRGTPYRYDDPFEPLVLLEDWEALK